MNPVPGGVLLFDLVDLGGSAIPGASGLLARTVDDLEDAGRADRFSRSPDDAQLLQRVDDLPQFVPAGPHVADNGRDVLFVLVHLEGDAILGEALPPSTLA